MKKDYTQLLASSAEELTQYGDFLQMNDETLLGTFF